MAPKGISVGHFKVSIIRTPIVYGYGVKANIKNLRPEMNPKDAIGNDPNIETPEDIVNKIEKLSK